MTTKVRIENTGHLPIVVNVWEAEAQHIEAKNIERYDLAPGEKTPDLTIWSWRRGVTILEAGAG